MIDFGQLAMLSILPIGGVLAAAVVLYLTRRTPEQVEADDASTLAEAQAEFAELEKRIDEIETYLKSTSDDTSAEARVRLAQRLVLIHDPSGRIRRPEARAAMHRHRFIPAE